MSRGMLILLGGLLLFSVSCVACLIYSNSPEERRKNTDYLACREYYRDVLGYPQYHECD